MNEKVVIIQGDEGIVITLVQIIAQIVYYSSTYDYSPSSSNYSSSDCMTAVHGKIFIEWGIEI